MVCLMEKRSVEKKGYFAIQDKAYFHSQTYVNLEATNTKKNLFGMIYEILDKIAKYQRNGWYFKEVLSLEIHTVAYKPLKGSSYLQLPDFIT